MKVDGRCLCGDVTYTADIEPERVAICHRANCQINSGAAYGVVASERPGCFKLLTGTLREIEKVAESGHIRALTFCPRCGARMLANTKGDARASFGL